MGTVKPRCKSRRMDGGRMSDAQPSAGSGARLDTPLFQMILSGFIGPVAPLLAFSTVSGAVFAMMGHPLVALIWTLATWTMDVLLTRRLRDWHARATEADAPRGYFRLGHIIILRSAFVLVPPTVVALISKDAADLIFVCVLAGGLTLISVVQTLFSAVLFRRAAVVPMVAVALAMLGAQQGMSDFAIFGMLLWLGGVLAIMLIAYLKIIDNFFG